MMIHLSVIKLYGFCGVLIIFSINTDLHTIRFQWPGQVLKTLVKCIFIQIVKIDQK